MTAPRRLAWIHKGQTSKAYPYEVIDTIRCFKVYWYGERGYELLASDLASRAAAITFAERHAQHEREAV